MPRLFTDELKDLRGGELIDELTDQMADLITAVDSARKPGSITIVLTVKPASPNSSAQIIADRVTLKLPEKHSNETIVFPTPEGSFLLDNPKQAKLPLTAVQAPRMDAASVVAPAPVQMSEAPPPSMPIAAQ